MELYLYFKAAMLFKRSPSPNPVNVSIKRRRGWVKLTVAGLSAALVIGSLVAWRASSAKKEDKKPTDVTLEFSPADITIVEQKSLTRTLPFSGSLSPLVQSTVNERIAGRRIVDRYHGRAEQQFVDLVEVAIVLVENFKEWPPEIARGVAGQSITQSAQSLIAGLNNQERLRSVENRIIGPAQSRQIIRRDRW